MEKKMFYKKARNWVKKLVIFKFLAVLIVTFQNCAPPVDNQGSYGSSGISKTAKMAYETKMDTLAYMSCSGNNIKNVFNFKLRAHSPYNSGIKFTEDYRQKTSTYKDSTLLSKLPQDPLSGAAALQMSLRSSQDFKQFDSIAKNTVGYAFGRVLSSEPIALAMHHLPNGLYANFINGMPENNLRRQLGISLLLDDVAEEKHEELRDSLRSSSSLVLSYQDGRGEETDLLQAGENFFGSEFKLNFGDSNGTSVTTAPKVASRLLSSVQERDMQSGQLKGLWKCQGPLKFVIVRPKDVDDGKVDCPRLLDGEQALSADLLLVRKTIDPTFSKWFINMANKCLIPKTDSVMCYGDTGGSSTDLDVSYNFQTCGTNNTICPHFLSLCTR